MSTLVHLMSIIPASTAAVERSFSTMNDVCSPLRSKLGQSTLESIMRICLEGTSDTELSEDKLDRLLETFKNKMDRKIKL